MSEPTIAQRILATVAEFRREGTLGSSLCWPSEELERLAMFAISAKNDLVRVAAGAGDPPAPSDVPTDADWPPWDGWFSCPDCLGWFYGEGIGYDDANEVCASCAEKRDAPPLASGAGDRPDAEQLLVQLAGCSVAALGGTTNPAKQGDYGWSVAYQDVLDLRRKYDLLAGDRLRLGPAAPGPSAAGGAP